MRTQRRRLQSGRKLSFTGELERCEVGRETKRPCLNPAAVKIKGAPFCEGCAREQEAYFTVGEITQELTDNRTKRAWCLLDERLVETLYRMRWEFTGRTSIRSSDDEIGWTYGKGGCSLDKGWR